MNAEMAELRKILDLFEGAGFTVTHLSAFYLSRRFEIAIKSSSIITFYDYEKETAKAGNVITLMEKNGYRVSTYRTTGAAAEYAGTMYLEIDSGEKETTLESALEHRQ
jgi:nucleoside diphosphate kinase